jgi:hypothetical protein
MRQSALSFVIDRPELASVPYCREGVRERGLVPHVTVLYPWHPAPLAASSIEQAARVVAGTGPLTMRFDRLGTFPSGVVYAAVADPEPVVALMERVWSAFPESAPYGGEFEQPVPHLTLGKCRPDDLSATLDEVTAQTRDRFPIEVCLAELGVLEQGVDGRWSVSTTVSLL